MPFQGNGHAVYRETAFALHNFVIAMAWAIHLIAQSCNGFASNSVLWRTTDHLAMVICRITDDDQFAWHLTYPPQFQTQTGKRHCNVQTDPAVHLHMAPQSALRFHLKVHIPRVEWDLPRRNRQHTQRDAG